MADQTKTEQPTQRRLEKARKDGQYPSARELISALQLVVFLGLLGSGGASWFAGLRETARSLFSLVFASELSHENITHMAWKLFGAQFVPLLLSGAAIAAFTLGFRLITTRFGLSLKKLAPDFNRLNPAARLKELPSNNFPALIQAVILLPAFLWAIWAVVRDKLDVLVALPLESVEAGCGFLATTLMELFWKAAGVFLIFGCVDLFRQMRRHNQGLRMSKQEIKDEHKEAEGNPQIKAKVRRLARDRARRQMMKEVPKATAVIVNPTHFAVAIRYQIESSGAPAVIAKGKNYLALRIRQKAIEHQVPIVENPPLAQALYKSVEVGQEIPPHLYRAVAEILAYVFKLMKGRLPG
jgi:flagellar biosynthetic protein FlhB